MQGRLTCNTLRTPTAKASKLVPLGIIRAYSKELRIYKYLPMEGSIQLQANVCVGDLHTT